MEEIRSANKGFCEQAFGRCGGNCSRAEGGSALILVVVLTSLLAIVGVMFLMVSRMDRMATSGISEDKQLDLAVDTVVGKICGQLVWDVPGTAIPDSMIFPRGMMLREGVEVFLFPDGKKHPEYHDYPGPEDGWLAASEPNNAKTWPQISDVTGYIARMGWSSRNLPITAIPDHSPIVFSPTNGSPADADGDGIADSKWIMLEGVTSSRGGPIYAAVRVTDNGGKINVNTAFKFDPDNPAIVDPFNAYDPNISGIDGTSLLHINLLALANRPSAVVVPADAADDVDALLLARANYGVNLSPYRLDLYEDNVIWRYGELQMPYTPFDISDELELRNRFLLNQEDIDARIERLGWTGSFINNRTLEVPIGQGGSSSTADDWFARANESVDRLVPDPADNRYDYRHLATTFSMDRIINPVGLSLNNGKMANVNGDVYVLRDAIRYGLQDADPTLTVSAADALASQLAANIKDFRDADSDVSLVLDSTFTGRYYGYERPCIYISEVAGIYTTDGTTNYKSFAVELHKPYSEDAASWWLQVPGANDVSISWSGTGDYRVILFETSGKTDLAGIVDPSAGVQSGGSFSLEGRKIYLRRSAPLGRVTVDSYSVPSAGAAGGWLSLDGVPRSFRRDISRHKCIRRLWDSTASLGVTLGKANGYVDTDTAIVQAHPYLDPNVYTTGFKNVGEIGMVFDVNAYNVPVGSKEADLRLDLRKSQYARLLNYLTVIDPTSDGRDSDGDGRTTDTDEIKVPGRININTAPPFVLEQLPWIAPAAVGPRIVDMVVACRDKLLMAGGPDFRGRSGRKGFGSIGELTQVRVSGFPGYYGMDYYGADGIDQDGFPDLTLLKLLGAGDGAADDIEERDLIFHRISNLVTVRSDVFTAYILVRIGADGPQRRMVAILDRSGVEPNNPNTKVKVRALHRMADAW